MDSIPARFAAAIAASAKSNAPVIELRRFGAVHSDSIWPMVQHRFPRLAKEQEPWLKLVDFWFFGMVHWRVGTPNTPSIGSVDATERSIYLLYKDYNFDHKFIFSVPNSTGLGLTATGLKKDQFFVGDISGLYKSGNVVVDVKVDTHNNVSTKVTLNDVFHSKKVALSFNIPDHKSGKYLHPHAAIDSSIDLNPAPRLELSAAIGSKDISIGGEVGFNTTSASFTKYNAGIAFNKPDFSATLML
ncbi:mitochondrial outer membrane protein porin 4-like, partial [Trifolium pratense]